MSAAPTMPNTAMQCLLRMHDEHHVLEDYQKGVPRWCTGCGDNAILAAVQRLCRDEGLRPDKTVFVSGIGCSSRFPYYLNTYGIHSSLPEERFLSAFSIQSFTQLPNFARMLALVRQVLRETAEAGFTEDEVQAAREHLYGALPLQLTSPGALLGLALDGLRAGLALSDIEQDWEALRDTPGERIHAAVRRLMGDGDFHLAVIGPAKELRAQLEGDAPQAVFPFKTPPERWPG
jgi:hypothetical protein